MAKVQGNKIEGTGSKVDYGMEYGRISAAYEKTGKELGKTIKNALKQNKNRSEFQTDFFISVLAVSQA